MGPICYIFNASDLKATIQGTKMHKYADDTYLLVPAPNTHLLQAELDHVEVWAANNNLRLNRSKSAEMIVVRPSVAASGLPPLLLGLQRVDNLTY